MGLNRVGFRRWGLRSSRNARRCKLEGGQRDESEDAEVGLSFWNRRRCHGWGDEGGVNCRGRIPCSERK